MSLLDPHSTADRPFMGALGEEYQFIQSMCPNVPVLHARIGAMVSASLLGPQDGKLQIVELGCGTGLLTASLLAARDDLALLAMDSEPTMLSQAQTNLAADLQSGKLTLLGRDALSALETLASASVDIVASAYCVHNFEAAYRRRTLHEVIRILKPGGIFINGDRYALDDPRLHTQVVQQEVVHFFKTFQHLQRLDLLEQWIVHLLSDESPVRIMRENEAVKELRDLGFDTIEWHFRDGVDGLLTAAKPAC